MNSLSTEIAKLAAYGAERGEITENDIRQLATRSQECTAFEWTDALMDGRPREALTMMGILSAQGESAIGLLALINSQFRKLTVARAMLDDGAPTDRIRQSMNMRSFALDKLLARARSLSARQIRKCLDTLIESDEGIRSGRFGENDAIRRAVFSIIAETSAPQPPAAM